MKGSGGVFSSRKAPPAPPPAPPPVKKTRKNISFSSDTKSPKEMRKEDPSDHDFPPIMRNKERQKAVTTYYNQQSKEKEAQWFSDIRSGKIKPGDVRGGKRKTRKHRKRGKNSRKVRK
jgi:hypothetical protein